MICSNCGKENATEYERTEGGKTTTVRLCAACYDLLFGKSKERACPVCGATFSDYKRTGLVGCAECYAAFREELLPVIRRVQQGNDRHDGKAPSGLADAKYDRVRYLVDQQATLREMLAEAQRNGESRRAEKLREELSRINKELYGGDT